MKTFSEACEATFMRTLPEGDNTPSGVAVEAIAVTMTPFHSMIEEIQESPEARGFADALFVASRTQGIPPHDLLCIAFSHGVMVGIEMEKAPLLVGREPPPEATQPTEAKS